MTTETTLPSRTRLVAFSAKTPFEFQPSNASAASLQKGRRRARYLTSSRQLVSQVLAANPEIFRIHDQGRQLDCLDPAAWSSVDVTGKRVLFILPSQALGNNVCIWFFLQAFVDQRQAKTVGVACTEASSDIFLLDRAFRVHSLWLAEKALKTWDHVIDLAHLPGRRDIELWPIDMEADLLDAFGLRPSERFPGRRRATTPNPRPAVGIFPIASSPLRTLPAETVAALAEALADDCAVTLYLNRFQEQGRLTAARLDPALKERVGVREGFESIGALIAEIAKLDYVVMADSGPAHMSKLSGTPGLAVYSSAPGDVLQGRFENLRAWQVPYEGEHCHAPCGLAKLRQAADGRVGCMGSLGVGVADLPNTPKRRDPGLVRRLTDQPVPCLQALRDEPAALVAAVKSDIAELFGPR